MDNFISNVLYTVKKLGERSSVKLVAVCCIQFYEGTFHQSGVSVEYCGTFFSKTCGSKLPQVLRRNAPPIFYSDNKKSTYVKIKVKSITIV